MDEKNKATETNAQPIATVEPKVEVAVQDDLEAKNAALEKEKADLIEREANYRVAYLKEKAKNDDGGDESDDERMTRIAKKALAESRIAEIAREQDIIIKKALKENKELKLAQLNKTDVPASVGAHNESQPVKDTLVTPEQDAAFKAKGWTDKDIERYKKNLIRYGGR